MSRALFNYLPTSESGVIPPGYNMSGGKGVYGRTQLSSSPSTQLFALVCSVYRVLRTTASVRSIRVITTTVFLQSTVNQHGPTLCATRDYSSPPQPGAASPYHRHHSVAPSASYIQAPWHITNPCRWLAHGHGYDHDPWSIPMV